MKSGPKLGRKRLFLWGENFFTPFDLSDGILVRLSIYSNSTNQVEDIIYNY
jgi:hypothetical protein